MATIKPAEVNDNPGEVMVAMMPLAKNINGAPHDHRVSRIIKCPRCGESCAAYPDLIRQAEVIYKGRMVALCTKCALYGHTRKPLIPLWLEEIGKSPDEVLQEVLEQVKDL
ncbi:hypothetical protein [Paenibacillus naphthalenovorans]|uniref:hypothetical protein n=1 Tax=Paenibacillus naphthalenovorans TaxID=162209 RepID=UPI003D2E6D50